MKKGFTHNICVQCWKLRNGEREPIKVKDPQPDDCCFCGKPTNSGIFIRANPDDTPFCLGHED